MPRRTAACRRVSHCVIYSPGASKMPLHAMGSKNSAYAGASGARRLAWRPDSVAFIAECGEPLQRGFPVLVLCGVDLAVLELRAFLGPQLDCHRRFGRMRSLGVQRETRAVGCSYALVTNLQALATVNQPSADNETDDIDENRMEGLMDEGID